MRCARLGPAAPDGARACGAGNNRQIWENYKLKSAKALSAGFLLLWTLGDSSYLISVAIRISYGGVLATQV